MAFLPELPSLDRFVNFDLLTEPMSWFVVFIDATIALLLFHVVMTAFGGMKDGGNIYNAGPGQVAAPVTTNFSMQGLLAGNGGSTLNNFWGGGIAGGDGTWTNGIESKYAEDGWAGLD